MKCSKCRLENPGSTMRCDCGYDFATGEIRDSYAAQAAGRRKPGPGLLVCGWAFSIIGGIPGIAIGCTLAFGKDNSSSAIYRYDDDSRKNGLKMLVLSIVSHACWLIWSFARGTP